MAKDNPHRGKPIPFLFPGDVVFVNNAGLTNMSRIQALKSRYDDGTWMTKDGWYVLNDGGNSSFSILRKIQPKEWKCLYQSQDYIK